MSVVHKLYPFQIISMSSILWSIVTDAHNTSFCHYFGYMLAENKYKETNFSIIFYSLSFHHFRNETLLAPLFCDIKQLRNKLDFQ